MSAPRRSAVRARIRPSTEALQASLERDLIEWADDVSLRLVWADLMQIDGDPLGRLIMLDHFGEAHPEVRPEAEALREQLRPRLEMPNEPEFRLHWERGFVHTLEVRPQRRNSSPETIARKIHDALKRPALRFLECLQVIVPDEIADAWFGAVLWTLHTQHASRRDAATHQTLQELHVGDPPRVRQRPSGAYEQGRGAKRHDYSGNPDPITKFPRLRRASVGGESARLPCRDGGTETRRHLVEKLPTRPLSSRNRTALIRAIWDASSLVQDAAFSSIVALGPKADFVIEDLELFLWAPIGDRDPRQAQALTALAAIGVASAGVLERVAKRDLEPFVDRMPQREPRSGNKELSIPEVRCIAFLRWAQALGRAGRPALKTVEKLLKSKPNEISSQVRSAANSARKAMLVE